MPRNSNQCSKCNQNTNYPYYQIHIEEEHINTKKTFCLECWKQEEKNYRKMSEEQFNHPTSFGLQYVHKYEAHLNITIIHWVEELRQWRYGKGQDDYDKDIGTLKDKDDDTERERERQFWSIS